MWYIIDGDGQEILRFAFRTLPLYRLNAEDFVRQHQAFMYPLLPTMEQVHMDLIEQALQEMGEIYRDDAGTLPKQLIWMKVLLERSGTIQLAPSLMV